MAVPVLLRWISPSARNAHEAMMAVLRENDITAWRERFVAALAECR